MQRLELPEVEALAQSRQLVPSEDASAYAEYELAEHPRRSGFWILFSAALLTVFWIGGALSFLYGYFGLARFGLDAPALVSFLSAELGPESWFMLAAALIVPSCFIWMTSLVGVRMAELTARARELGDVSRRLTAPETSATRRVARVGHAVRREVGTLNESVDWAISRIAELRDGVQDESAKLERIANDAEERTRRIRSAIAEERSELTTVVERFESEAASLVEALTARSDALAATLAEKAAGLARTIDEKAQSLVSGMTHAGATASQALDETSLAAARRFEEEAQSLSQRLLSAGDELATRLSEQHTAANERLRTTGERLSTTVDDSTTKLADKLATSAAALDETLKARGESLARGFYEQNALINKVLDDIQRDVDAALERLGHNVTEQGKTAIVALKRNGEQIVSLLAEKSAELTDLMESRATLLRDAAEAADERLRAVGTLIDEQATGLDKAAKTVVASADYANKELADQSARLEGAADKALERASEIAERYAEQRAAIEAASEGLSRENAQLGGTLDSQKRILDEIAAVADTQGERIRNVLTQSTQELRGAIEHIIAQSSAAREALSSTAHDARESGASAAGALETAARAAHVVAEEALKSIDERARAMTEKIGSVGSAADEALAHLRERLDEHAATLTADVASAAEKAETATKAARERMAAELVEMNERLTQSAEAVQDLAERMSHTVEHVSEAAGEATERLEGAMLDLEARLAEFPEQTQETARELRQAFERQVKIFADAAAKAAGEARALDEALRQKLTVNYETLGKLLFGVDAPARPSPKPEPPAVAPERLAENGAGDIAGQPWKQQPDLVAFVRPASKREPSAASDSESDQAGLARRLALRLRRPQDEAPAPIDSSAATAGEPPPAVQSEQEPKRAAAPKSNSEILALSPAEPPSRSWKWRDILAAADSGDFQPASRKSAGGSTKRRRGPEAASYLSDSLHALAVELTRSIEDKMSVQLVRRYLKGEKELFARRLVESERKKTVGDMKSRYKSDATFKATADQYMSRFDELMELSVGDKGGQKEAERLLQSNVGQVYLMLREAAGRIF